MTIIDIVNWIDLLRNYGLPQKYGSLAFSFIVSYVYLISNFISDRDLSSTNDHGFANIGNYIC